MFIRLHLLAIAIVITCAATSAATNVQLTLSIDQAAQTWQVGMTMADAQNLGLVSYSVDVLGSGGISILQAADPSQTNATPSVFGLFRTNGTINGNSLTEIQASQYMIEAVEAHNDSNLGYGYGLPSQAIGIFKGPVAPQPITLAQGRWSYGPVVTNPQITARLTPGDYFNEFPLKWDASNTPYPAGSLQSAIGAGSVVTAPITSPVAVPEPSTFVLLCLAALGCRFAARHRRGRCRTNAEQPVSRC